MQHNSISDLPARRRRAYFIPRTPKKISGWVPELNSPAFKAELQEVVDTLRESVLKNRFAMERFCYEHGGKISGGWTQNYGYIVETERYRYCLTARPVALCPALWYTAHSYPHIAFIKEDCLCLQCWSAATGGST